MVPEPGLGSIPIALTVSEHEEDLLAFVNAWLEEGQASGLIQPKLDYWVRGEGARAGRGPRWSNGRDVLGWWR